MISMLYINLFKVAYSIYESKSFIQYLVLHLHIISLCILLPYTHQSENLYYELGEGSLIANNILTKYFECQQEAWVGG
jgi:hypothetical protein